MSVPLVTAIPAEGPAFTTRVPPSTTATWIGLRWRRLAADDPLRRIYDMVRWQHGFIALGVDQPSQTQLAWTSDDGGHWVPLPLTFPAGAAVAMIDRPGGVAAVTQNNANSVEAWVSTDTRTWDAVVVPEDFNVAHGFLLASGPSGLLLASLGTAPRLLRATEASHWQFGEGTQLPEQFELNDLRGTASGFVAVGQWMASPAASGATATPATFWSSDGLHWPSSPTFLPAPRGSRFGDGPAFASLEVGRDGMIAREAGATRWELWWQSSDGRRWRALPSNPPLGTTAGGCDSVGCHTLANGHLFSNGSHIVAVRFGHDAGAWDSTDGRTWRQLTMTGNVPVIADLISASWPAMLLPGGLIYSEGSSWWFGEPVVR